MNNFPFDRDDFVDAYINSMPLSQINKTKLPTKLFQERYKHHLSQIVERLKNDVNINSLLLEEEDPVMVQLMLECGATSIEEALFNALKKDKLIIFDRLFDFALSLFDEFSYCIN